jgi:protein-S-isoprenylcysteine O-methyltransferase Ste14
VVEEALKGAAVLVLYWRHRAELSGIIDGLVYSAMVGLGFAVTENVTYYLEALAGGEEAFAATVVGRGVLSPFAHPLFTAMFGMGLAVAAESARWRLAPPVLGFADAVGLHALWNGASLAGGAFVLVYLVVFVPVFAAVVVTAIRATRREERLLRRHLAEEIDTGRLTGDEVDKLTSLRRRRAAERESAAGGGEAKHVRRSFHHAATQLAFTRHRRRTGSGGRVPPAEVEDFWLAEMQRRRRLVRGPETG